MCCDFIPRCRERPSALRVDGPGQGGVEAGGKCYPIVQDPTGPITGTKPQDENQMDQDDLRLPEGGSTKEITKEILFTCLGILFYFNSRYASFRLVCK